MTNFARNSEITKKKNRAIGALVGLALGDALGTTVEFSAPGSFEPLKDIVGGGPFGLKPGEWTDDTSMALCLTESLIECRGFDPSDQMQRYCRWWRDGHLSVNGRCFDIGNTVRDALKRFLQEGQPYAGSPDPFSAGNGSLMRLAPIAITFAPQPRQAIELAGESSRTTHGAPECIHACRYFSGLLVGLFNGESKAEVLQSAYSPVDGRWEQDALAPKVMAIANGSFKTRKPPQIRGTGYVIDSLEAALWAFHSTQDFSSAVLAAANLGDDADTTAAICGQIAGACYGMCQIPSPWIKKLALADMILNFANELTSFW